MISILPEHAPPGSNIGKLTLVVADDVIANFTASEAMETLTEYASWLVRDITDLELMKLVPGEITLESLNIALNFIVITDYYGEEDKHWTNTYHNLVRIKFMLQKQ